MNLPDNLSCTIAVIGLGYVGLPLAIEISKNQRCFKTKKKITRKVIGYDLSIKRISELKKGIDITNEIIQEDFSNLEKIELTNNAKILSKADVFLVTVPTPIDNSKKPNLNPLISASKIVGEAIKKRSKDSCITGSEISNPVIIYESTVFPGATEEICIPILEKYSELDYKSSQSGKTFFVGYSPERINPGDQSKRLTNIVKVTSGDNSLSSKWVDQFYSSFISAGTFLAENIKVAEAAKIIENTQRDINIALINELSIIFRKMDIDIFDVLNAAGTKWNFMPFKPGLVGGHCIGVDPYYLTYKAEQLNYYPEIVLSGRKINDYRASWLSHEIVNEMEKKEINILGSKVLIFGFTFKANCPDTRNTKIFDLVTFLTGYGLEVKVVDPLADLEETKNIYKINILRTNSKVIKSNVIIAAVDHKEFLNYSSDKWLSYAEKKHLFVDLKDIIPRSLNPLRI